MSLKLSEYSQCSTCLAALCQGESLAASSALDHTLQSPTGPTEMLYEVNAKKTRRSREYNWILDPAHLLTDSGMWTCGL